MLWPIFSLIELQAIVGANNYLTNMLWDLNKIPFGCGIDGVPYYLEEMFNEPFMRQNAVLFQQQLCNNSMESEKGLGFPAVLNAITAIFVHTRQW